MFIQMPIHGLKEEVKMEIRVQSLKFDADQKLLEFVEKKVSKIGRFDDAITDVEVVLSLLEKPENKNVKLKVHVPGGSQVIERNAQTFEIAVNECVDAMKEKLTRNKAKPNSGQRTFGIIRLRRIAVEVILFPYLQTEQHYDLSRNHTQEHFYRVNRSIGN